VVWRVKQCKPTMEKRSSRMTKQVWVKKVIPHQPSIQSNLDTLTAGEYLGVIDTCHSESLLDTLPAPPRLRFPSHLLLRLLSHLLFNPKSRRQWRRFLSIRWRSFQKA
jgi:hypothetical protein